MSAAPIPIAGPRPRWGGTLARSVYTGVVLGMLSGFLTLLFTISVLWVRQFLLHRSGIDIRIVYREIAPAVAVSVAVLAFLGNVLYERTHPAPVAAGLRS